MSGAHGSGFRSGDGQVRDHRGSDFPPPGEAGGSGWGGLGTGRLPGFSRQGPAAPASGTPAG